MVESAIQQIVCCLGQPVAGNPSQFMMERAFAAAGLDWRYLTLEVPPQHLGDAIRGIRALGFCGANLTIPHKVAALEYLDRLTDAATLMGAVNCIHREGEILIGENTDGKGFVQSLQEITAPQDKTIAVLGAGGAARAIAVELALSGAARLRIVNRTAQRGQDLVELLRNRVGVTAEYLPWDGDYVVPADVEILINATSIGLGDPDARVPVAADSFRPGLVVADVVFNPAQTVFLREAAQHGCVTLHGLGMLANQAAIAFQIWTGQDPDRAVMREALEEFLEL